MPILDLNEWPQENNVSAVYILWARMVFPNDPKLRKQFTAVRLADLKTVILFATDLTQWGYP